MITASIERARAIDLPPGSVPALRSGRVRVLVRRMDVLGSVLPGDGLWVREWCTIARRQKRRDMLDITYPGDGRPTSVPWMAALAKPRLGLCPPGHMPVQASRMTLLVDRVEHLRLSMVDEDTAVAAGVDPEGGGYGALGFPFLRPFKTHTEALAFMLQQQGCLEEAGPYVDVIHFRAVERNIARLVCYAE